MFAFYTISNEVELVLARANLFSYFLICNVTSPRSVPEMHFLKEISSFKSSSEAAQKCSESEEESTIDASGYMKTYQRFPALKHHLDCRRHKRALEHETVYGYSDRIQQPSDDVPFIQEVVKKVLRNVSNEPCLPMEWVLKSSQVALTRLTERVLIQQILHRKDNRPQIRHGVSCQVYDDCQGQQ